ISDVSLVEGNTGTKYALVSVSLNTPSNQTVTVNYATADGTATAGSDYASASGRLTFARGEMSKTIAVPVYGDRLLEADEPFFVTLGGARRARIADGQGIVTIVADEPRVGISDASVVEGNDGTTLMTFIVSLGPASDEAVTVNFATANGTAAAGEDYRA